MNNRSNSPNFTRPRAAQAEGAEWVTRVHAGNLKHRERKALRNWLAASTENARDYLRAETIWRLSGSLAHDPQVQTELATMRNRPALSASTNIDPENTARSTWRSRSYSLPGALGAAAALLITLAATLWLTLSSRTQWYETAAGEQRVVTLEDGSTVAINTATRVGVVYLENERRLLLDRGEALFQATKNPKRPFIVHAARGTVRAVGTRFNIMVNPDAVTVSVLEGRVAVVPSNTATESVQTSPVDRTPKDPTSQAQHDTRVARRQSFLNEGESIAYAHSGELLPVNPENASRQRIVAWREGKLRFDDWPLERAVREHNRYAVKPLRFGSPELENLRVSGVFHIGDTEALLSALRQLVDLRTTDEGNALVLTVPAAKISNEPL